MTWNERIELPEQDEADLHRLYAEPDGDDKEAVFHPILEIWREVLAPAKGELEQAITPQWANRIVGAYKEMHFSDMEDYRLSYFNKLVQLADMLDQEIASDPECLTYTDPGDDAIENAFHYKNLLLNWQQAVLQWELDWNTSKPEAAVELAAISEVHKMFFGPQGITAFLDNIGFEFTDDDQQTMLETLEDFKARDDE